MPIPRARQVLVSSVVDVDAISPEDSQRIVTLIMSGLNARRGDALLNSQETRDRVERYVRNGRVTYVENAGHVLPPQTPKVTEFLKRRLGGEGMDAETRSIVLTC